MGVTADKLDDGLPKLRKTYARALMEEVRVVRNLVMFMLPLLVQVRAC